MKDDEQLYSRSEIRAKAVSVAIFATVLVVAVVILSSMSLGWFTVSKQTKGALSVSARARHVDADFLCERLQADGSYAPVPVEDRDGESIFPADALFPGDRLRFTVTLTNNDSTDCEGLRVSLIDADEEIPVTKTVNGNDAYYWFSSQLRILGVTVTDATATDKSADAFLFSPSDMDMTSTDAASPTYTVTDEKPQDLSVATLDLGAGQTATVSFILEFYHTDYINQNDYKSFGAYNEESASYDNGYIRRRILVDFS